MKLKSVVGFACVLALIVLGLSQFASAALLVPIESGTFEEPSDSAPFFPDADCLSGANGTAELHTKPTFAGIAAATQAFRSANENCTEPLLDTTARAYAYMNLEIQAETGEAVGDCVRIDYQTWSQIQVERQGAEYSAAARISAADQPALPARIVLNPSTKFCEIASYGPTEFTSNGLNGDVHISIGSFIARIGDIIRIEAEVSSTAEGSGVGAAASQALTELEMGISETLGPCSEPYPCILENESGGAKPVPTMNVWGLFIIASGMLGAGGFYLRKNRHNRRNAKRCLTT